MYLYCIFQTNICALIAFCSLFKNITYDFKSLELREAFACQGGDLKYSKLRVPHQSILPNLCHLKKRSPRKTRTSKLFGLLFELNRRMPNGTYSGVIQDRCYPLLDCCLTPHSLCRMAFISFTHQLFEHLTKLIRLPFEA